MLIDFRLNAHIICVPWTGRGGPWTYPR